MEAPGGCPFPLLSPPAPPRARGELPPPPYSSFQESGPTWQLPEPALGPRQTQNQLDACLWLWRGWASCPVTQAVCHGVLEPRCVVGSLNAEAKSGTSVWSAPQPSSRSPNGPVVTLSIPFIMWE